MILVVLVMFFGGLWGTMVLRSVLIRFSRPEVQAGAEDPRVSQVIDEARLLEARLERAEEELAFLRELRAPEPPAQLPDAENRET